MNSTIISDGQSLVDVAVQELGTVDALFDLADAAGLAITDVLSAGQLLPVPDSTNVAADVVRYFRQRGQRINTGDELPAAPVPAPQRYFSSLFFRPTYFA